MNTQAPAPAGIARRIAVVIASGFGLGWSPVASGTAGTLLGVAIVLAFPFRGLAAQLCFAAVLVIASIPLCSIAERHFGGKDDGRIVADEYMTFPVCLLGLPWQDHLWLLAAAFLTHRVFDILKPFPAYRSQKLPGGLGIVADDFISSLYALAANWGIWLLVTHFK
jgi:phosphatidylglycerophosphatase A